MAPGVGGGEPAPEKLGGGAQVKKVIEHAWGVAAGVEEIRMWPGRAWESPYTGV
ncbi:hypothetical protein [Pyrodictium abyssi]|uniref:Uncharacterized protein n=1 Tax=Pyrodictium abyssi TaxID=54256 RepID=A0ABN6ZRB6_9CREN|nr:hypothetical protein PABY_23790 [Pyrodictium abyssi]